MILYWISFVFIVVSVPIICLEDELNSLKWLTALMFSYIPVINTIIAIGILLYWIVELEDEWHDMETEGYDDIRKR